MTIIVCKICLLFMSLLTALIVKNILAGIDFTFLKKCPKPNLKVFQYQIWTSVDQSAKKTKNITIFSKHISSSATST